jgi:hypothetical protein
MGRCDGAALIPPIGSCRTSARSIVIASPKGEAIQSLHAASGLLRRLRLLAMTKQDIDCKLPYVLEGCSRVPAARA